jgi:hypothetical protein
MSRDDYARPNAPATAENVSHHAQFAQGSFTKTCDSLTSQAAPGCVG